MSRGNGAGPSDELRARQQTDELEQKIPRSRPPHQGRRGRRASAPPVTYTTGFSQGSHGDFTGFSGFHRDSTGIARKRAMPVDPASEGGKDPTTEPGRRSRGKLAGSSERSSQAPTTLSPNSAAPLPRDGAQAEPPGAVVTAAGQLASKLARQVLKRTDVEPYMRPLFFVRRLQLLPGALPLGPIPFAEAMGIFMNDCGEDCPPTRALVLTIDLWNQVHTPGGLDAFDRACLEAVERPVTLRSPLAECGPELAQLVSIAFWLQVFVGDGAILLPQKRLGEEVGCSQPWVSHLLGVLKHFGILQVLTAGRYADSVAAEYRMDLASPHVVAPPVKKPGARSPAKVRPAALARAWNRYGTQLQKVVVMDESRCALARKRLRERPIAEWVEIIKRINVSPYCRGENDRGWVACIDFILRDTMTGIRVLEGFYDKRVPRPTPGDDGPQYRPGTPIPGRRDRRPAPPAAAPAENGRPEA